MRRTHPNHHLSWLSTQRIKTPGQGQEETILKGPKLVTLLSPGAPSDLVWYSDSVLRCPFSEMGTTAWVCHSTGTVPDLHTALKRLVSQNIPKMSRAFSISYLIENRHLADKELLDYLSDLCRGYVDRDRRNWDKSKRGLSLLCVGSIKILKQ